MGDAKETGGRWWEGEGAAGFNFTEDAEGDNNKLVGCDEVRGAFATPAWVVFFRLEFVQLPHMRGSCFLSP